MTKLISNRNNNRRTRKLYAYKPAQRRVIKVNGFLFYAPEGKAAQKRITRNRVRLDKAFNG